jgi:hypothetical protein
VKELRSHVEETIWATAYAVSFCSEVRRTYDASQLLGSQSRFHLQAEGDIAATNGAEFAMHMANCAVLARRNWIAEEGDLEP